MIHAYTCSSRDPQQPKPCDCDAVCGLCASGNHAECQFEVLCKCRCHIERLQAVAPSGDSGDYYEGLNEGVKIGMNDTQDALISAQSILSLLYHREKSSLKPDSQQDVYDALVKVERAVKMLPPNPEPLCAVHQNLDQRNQLEVEIGNNCVACSLNERAALLQILAPCASEDNSEDSVTVMQRVVDFYNTHAGENRVMVSYPAQPPAGQGR